MYLVPHITAQKAELINRRAAYIIIGLCFVAGHAGGLGMTPLVTLAGIIGLLTRDISQAKSQLRDVLMTPWVMALALFFGWIMVTTLWSSYQPSGMNNALMLFLGVIFYDLGRRAMIRAAGDSRVHPVNALQKLLIYLPVIAGVVLCLDLASGFGLSYAFDPPSAGEALYKRRHDAIMNTANGIVFLILMSAPAVIIMLWTRYRGPIIAVLLLALIVISAVLNGLSVAVVAIILSITAMLLAAFYPKITLRALTAASMMLVGFAPIVSALAMTCSNNCKASLPFSWEHRLVTWSYVGERIREHPIVGHGFDASRTFDATFKTRGFDMSVVSLHPHNAGLQIWLETGIIGAILAVVFLWYLGLEALKFAQGGRARAMATAGVFAPVILISSVSYGVWQNWWWATLFITAGILSLVPRTKIMPNVL